MSVKLSLHSLPTQFIGKTKVANDPNMNCHFFYYYATPFFCIGVMKTQDENNTVSERAGGGSYPPSLRFVKMSSIQNGQLFPALYSVCFGGLDLSLIL